MYAEKKLEEAKKVADYHSKVETEIKEIRLINSEADENEDEPIKLLEVNLNTIPTGIVPVSFAPSKDMDSSLVIVDVTPDEYDEIKSGDMPLPDGWELGDVLFTKVGVEDEPEGI